MAKDKTLVLNLHFLNGLITFMTSICTQISFLQLLKVITLYTMLLTKSERNLAI